MVIRVFRVGVVYGRKRKEGRKERKRKECV